MKKLLCLIPLLCICTSAQCSDPSSIVGMYVITTNTTTFTAVGTPGRYAYLYNPGTKDIKIASATTSSSTAQYTVKAATYFPYPIAFNGQLYAIATDTNGVTLESLIVR
jgi:hypothetical protein